MLVPGISDANLEKFVYRLLHAAWPALLTGTAQSPVIKALAEVQQFERAAPAGRDAEERNTATPQTALHPQLVLSSEHYAAHR